MVPVPPRCTFMLQQQPGPAWMWAGHSVQLCFASGGGQVQPLDVARAGVLLAFRQGLPGRPGQEGQGHVGLESVE
jgi:hypothetical protein